ncbi:MAG: hypothetical protein FWC48_04340 [Actinomycetia bacterium]|nr:hypothetical protein [Actinomycetes bacterium]
MFRTSQLRGAGVLLAIVLGCLLLLIPTIAAAATVQVGTETALRSAVTAAAGTPTTIELTADISLTGTDLIIGPNQNITLTGVYTLTQTASTRAVTVQNNTTFAIEGPVISHSTGVAGSGVVVNAGGTCKLGSGGISGNTVSGVSGSGAGVFVNGGTFIMTGGIIQDNNSAFGAGLYNGPGGTVLLNGGIISDNTATDSGGGLDNEGTVTLQGTTITRNSAVNNGGGIVNWAGTLNFSSGTISANTANHGAGIYNEGGSSAILFETGGTISGNVATDSGGGIYSTSANISIENAVIENNKALNGGGIYFQDANATLNFIGDTFNGNSAEERGGGLFIDAADFTMEGGVITQNSATYGGGIYMTTAGATMTLLGDSIESNKALGTTATQGFGGGVYTVASVTVDGGDFKGNSANFGGGLFIDAGNNASAVVSSGSFVSNTALTDGGAIWISYDELADLTVKAGVSFSKNSAAVAYDRNPADDPIYAANIFATSWTFPLPQGYNNWDISYTNGDPVPFFTVTFDPGAHGSFAAVTHSDIMRGLYTPAPPTPTGKPGWVFAGWKPAVSDTVTGDVTYVAQWVAELPEPEPSKPEAAPIPATGDDGVPALIPALIALLGGSVALGSCTLKRKRA